MNDPNIMAYNFECLVSDLAVRAAQAHCTYLQNKDCPRGNCLFNIFNCHMRSFNMAYDAFKASKQFVTWYAKDYSDITRSTVQEALDLGTKYGMTTR